MIPFALAPGSLCWTRHALQGSRSSSKARTQSACLTGSMHGMFVDITLTVANGHRTNGHQLVLARHQRTRCAHSPTHLATHSQRSTAVYVACAKPYYLGSLQHRHVGILKQTVSQWVGAQVCRKIFYFARACSEVWRCKLQ
jgi:hypothetical protein